MFPSPLQLIFISVAILAGIFMFSCTLTQITKKTCLFFFPCLFFIAAHGVQLNQATSCGFLNYCYHFPAFPKGELKEKALDLLFLAAIEKCQEHHRAVYGNRLLTPAHIQGNVQCCDFSKSIAV